MLKKNVEEWRRVVDEGVRWMNSNEKESDIEMKKELKSSRQLVRYVNNDQMCNS